MRSTDASATTRRRAFGLLGAVIAVSIGAATVVAADSSRPRGTPGTTDPRHEFDVASWAAANGLTGLSPADVAPAPSRITRVDQAVVGSWAVANGLTGLSPASLARIPDRFVSADQSDVASWATSNGLTGLSPAHLIATE